MQRRAAELVVHDSAVKGGAVGTHLLPRMDTGALSLYGSTPGEAGPHFVDESTLFIRCVPGLTFVCLVGVCRFGASNCMSLCMCVCMCVCVWG